MKRPRPLRLLLIPAVLLISGAAGVPGVAAQATEATNVTRSLGRIDGPPGQIFDRIQAIHSLPGGRLLVADGGSRQLRIYGEGPEPIATFGRDGEGPGEFRSLEWVAPYRGDSIVVWDGWLGRLTVVSGSLDLGRTIRLSAPAGASIGADPRSRAGSELGAVGALADGRFLARRGQLAIGPGDTTSVRRDRFAYVLVDPGGRFERELVTLPDDEQFVWAEGDSRTAQALAFGRTTAVAVRGARLAWATNDGFRVHVRDLGTGAEVEREADRARAAVTDRDRERWIAMFGPDPQLPPQFRRSRERTIEAMPFPDRFPWHGRLVLADDGGIWLEEYPADPAARPVWTRFPPSGEPARIRFPAGFQLLTVDAGRAYGVTVGELDVQRVTVIELP